MKQLIQELQQRIQGEVRFDKYSCVLYSTDASIYQVEPRGVVIPRIDEDVQTLVELAAKHNIPIIPRGGGTSLVGQSIGDGIIIDFSKYMNSILEVNSEESWARVQPGVVLDQLNSHVAKFDLFFGPDVATSSRANLGGMIGNNSSGAHSIVYGKTIDHVLETHVILSDGSKEKFKKVSNDELNHLQKSKGLLNNIYSTTQSIAINNRDEILKRYPKVMRRVGGYNLDAFITDEPFNLSKMIVGSEGTLGILTEAKVNLVPTPKETVLCIIHFKTLFEALDAVNYMLEFQPSSVELIDDKIINITRNTMEFARRLTFVEGNPEALLLVEFQGNNKTALKSRMEAFVDKMIKSKIGYAHIKAVEKKEQQNVWYIRKAGLGLIMGTREARKPVGFVEDSAVPVENLAKYIREFDQIIRDHKTDACYYAHASVGLLHIRPLLDLKDDVDIRNMQSIADAVSDLVLKYGGAFSGEHGDGLARSCFNEKMFGPQLYNAFKEIKKVFDPQNIFNPGKIIASQKLTDNLRYTLRKQVSSIQTTLDFSKEGGFFQAIEMCNGNGICRKNDTGTMCPSYMVTKEEEHSTRGRANALRAVLSGNLDFNEFSSKRMYEVMELCVACKGCKGECPSNVDMAKIKYEFLHQYHKKNGISLRDWTFANIAILSKLGSITAPFSNWILNLGLTRLVMHHLFGIEKQKVLPPFVKNTFEKWFVNNYKSKGTKLKKVVLFNDTFMTYNNPNIGVAAVKILEKLGYEIILADKKCCGRTYLSKGVLDKAKSNARYNVESLYPLVKEGYQIVGCEPSCILTFRDEYIDLLDDPRTKDVAENSFLIEEFLLSQINENKSVLKFKNAESNFLVHGHCHMKAIVGINPLIECLKLIPNANIEVIDSGCCGMAGSFGFEKEHYEISLKMANRKLFETIKSKDQSWQIVAPGTSCRQQIQGELSREVKHPVEVLAEHLLDN